MFCRRSVTAAGFFAVLALLTGRSEAQLRVLSSKPPAAAWQASQIEAIEAQLKQASLGQQMRSELSAQRRWLSSWKPGQLSDSSLLPAKSQTESLTEPIIDPTGIARPLREKLLGEKASPTKADTEKLQALLASDPNDVGVRQLHLHWLDQYVYRKKYSDEIADAALRLQAMLEQLGGQQLNSVQKRQIELAKTFCLYRRGRALVYRELPEVLEVDPLEDPKAHEAALLGVFEEFAKREDAGNPAFVLLRVRMLRRDNWFGRSLELLEEHGKDVSDKWLLKKRRDLLRELGWTIPADEAAKFYAKRFPEEVAKEKKADS